MLAFAVLSLGIVQGHVLMDIVIFIPVVSDITLPFIKVAADSVLDYVELT